MEGTFVSESIFHDYIPAHVPKPLAWGYYKSDPMTWFYLCEFHYLIDRMPDPQSFVSIIAKVHEKSNGKSDWYGFDLPTHLANIPNDNAWQSSWQLWFAQAMRKMFQMVEQAHGRDEELEALKAALFDKVIPRLLSPLETGGRSIKPCLVHSDLWPGNVMLDGSGSITIFDSCAFWGHNEADLGSWRAPRYNMGQPYLEEYQRAMGVSEPKDDFDDRNALYAM